MIDHEAETLFAIYLAWVDAAYLAFSREPFASKAEADAAYQAKDRRTAALCKLRGRVELLGYAGVAEWEKDRR